jgi:hypothetical protein
MDTEVPALRLIGDETDAGVCVDGVCAVPPPAKDAAPEETAPEETP